MKAIIILILLACACNSLKFEGGIFAEISQKNPFGDAVTALLELSVENEAPPTQQLQTIRDLLSSIKSELQVQQETAQENFNAGQAACATGIAALEADLEALKVQLAESTQSRDDLVEEQRLKSEELAQKRSDVEQDQRDLTNYERQKMTEEAVSSEQSASFNEAIAACDEAIRLLGQIVVQHSAPASFAQNGMMFVQLSKKFENVKELLQKSEEKTPNAFIQPIIDVLVQLGSSTKINYEQVEQILTLIRTLRDRLAQGLSSRETANQVNQENLIRLIGDLQQQVTEHTSQIRTYEERLTALTEALANKDAGYAITTEVTRLKTLLLDITKADCQQQRDNFASATTQRANSVAMLDRLIEYFENQVVAATGVVDIQEQE